MAALTLLEDGANASIRMEQVLKDREDFLAHDGDWHMNQFQFPISLPWELRLNPGYASPCSNTDQCWVFGNCYLSVGFR